MRCVKILKNFLFRLCLVAEKRFPENTYFPEMLISGKGKCFHGVWLHFKKFSRSRSRSTARSREALIAISDLPLPSTYEISRSTLREIAPSIAISIRCNLAKARSRSTVRSRDSEIAINGDCNVCRQDRDRRGLEIAIARTRTLSLSLSLSLSHFPEIL